MAKIIHEGQIYQEISLTMFHESEVQASLGGHSKLVFPGYNYLEFNPLIIYEEDSARPDFALIEQHYRSWCVGEVEMLRHDLTGHVLRQVRIFVNGDYNDKHIRKIMERRPDLDPTRLRLLIQSVRPQVLVVADKADVAWRSAIRGEGAKMAIFEMFRKGNSSDMMFRVNGDMPEVPAEFLSYCQFDPSIRRLLRIRTPAGIAATNNQRVLIEFEGAVSEWVYMVGEDKAWLNPVGHPNLPDDALFVLSLDEDQKLKLEARKNATHGRP